MVIPRLAGRGRMAGMSTAKIVAHLQEFADVMRSMGEAFGRASDAIQAKGDLQSQLYGSCLYESSVFDAEIGADTVLESEVAALDDTVTE